MVWLSRVIDQDVNIFNGARLLATSERDLFASGLLPRARRPTSTARIVLDRLPTVITEEQVGRIPLHGRGRAGAGRPNATRS